MTKHSLLNNLNNALELKSFNEALEIYHNLYKIDPSCFLSGSNDKKSTSQIRHCQNAASLARMSLFESLISVRNTSTRLSEMVNIFIGISKQKNRKPMQSPSFLYIPNLDTQPFFSSDQILGLDLLIEKIREYIPFLQKVSTSNLENYIETVGNIPSSEEWEKLRNNRWKSTHFIKGGKPASSDDSEFNSLVKLFLESKLVCHCTTHAPEVFVSVLDGYTQIPEHFGVSNAKLTVHIPINVTENAHLTVAKQTVKWGKMDKYKIFDDSFQHSAKNAGASKRSVLIFDIWNPFLDRLEREAIDHFFKTFDYWHKRFGMLANLDDML